MRASSADRREATLGGHPQALERYALAVLRHIGLVAAWYLFVKLGEVPKFVMPSPYDTVHALVVPNYRWPENIAVTAVEIFAGYILAVVFGIGAALLFSWFRWLEMAMMPLLVSLNMIPKVALGPLIDEAQRDKVHGLVTSTVDSGARLAAGGRYEGLFYRPTVLDGVHPEMPAYAEEIFGPVAPVVRFADVDEAVRLAADSGYGLSLGILTGDVSRGLALADRIPTGIVHVNDQTVNDEAVAPFGGVGASGTGSRQGGPQANIESFTETQWVTLRGDLPAYPF